MTNDIIEIWEDDYGVMTIVGTHDEKSATTAALDYYHKTIGLDLSEVEGISAENAEQAWISPEFRNLPDDWERLPEELFARKPVEGWIPALVKDMRW